MVIGFSDMDEGQMTVEKFAEDLWITEGEIVNFYGFAYPTRCVIVTSRSSPPYDFVSRCFGPAAGIDEDPVTGSSHCCLGLFWKERLGKDEFLAYQASSRGGEVRGELTADHELAACRRTLDQRNANPQMVAERALLALRDAAGQ